MKRHGISQMPVLSGGKLAGIVAEADLLHALVAGELDLDGAVGTLAESDYATVSRNTKLELVQGLLSEARIAIAVDGDELLGVVTKIDLIDHITRGTRSVPAPSEHPQKS